VLAKPLVSVEAADVRLAGRALLAGVDFTLREGEQWAIVGANGSGKTSLLRLLRGELWPFPVGRRTYHFVGPPQESPIGARERIALVSPELQDAYARRQWDVAVERVVLGGFTDSVYPQEDATAEQARRVAEVLAELGIARLRGRSMLELSTGERRRVLLARALAPRPRVLLLDEATEGLDAASRATFVAQVSAVARGGTAIVIATHRSDEIFPELNRVAVMEEGRIARVGGRELLDALGTGTSRSPATSGTATLTGTATPTGTPTPTSTPTEASADTVLALDHVSVHLDDGTPVLHDVTWRLGEGESWAIVGPNGAGKTSLLKLVAGELGPMPGGRVFRRGLEARAGRDDVQREVAFVGPDLHARHVNDVPVLDVVVSGVRRSIGIDEPPSRAERATARAALERCGAAHLEGRTVLSISYGELRRVLVARALAAGPRLLVLDEPFAGLDPRARAALEETLEALAAGGVQLLVSAHHEEDLGPMIGHALELRSGRVVRAGPRN
jgi:molybdate transport system ATP-binding protein